MRFPVRKRNGPGCPGLPRPPSGRTWASWTGSWSGSGRPGTTPAGAAAARWRRAPPGPPGSRRAFRPPHRPQIRCRPAGPLPRILRGGWRRSRRLRQPSQSAVPTTCLHHIRPAWNSSAGSHSPSACRRACSPLFPRGSSRHCTTCPLQRISLSSWFPDFLEYLKGHLPDRFPSRPYLTSFCSVVTSSSTASSRPSRTSSTTQVRMWSASSSLLNAARALWMAVTCVKISMQ